jgi:fluoride exporter
LKLVYIAVGGAIGALLRYGVSGLAFRMGGTQFPWGTLAVNITGSVVIGFLWAVSSDRPFSSQATAFLFIGVLGAFTTFSSYSLETVNLLRDGQYGYGVANLLFNNAGAIAGVVVGLLFGRFILATGR